MKYAVLSLDIEDWYHLDYFSGKESNREYSMLDGLEVYRETLASHNIPSSYFVLGEIAQSLKTKLRQLVDQGNDIGSHGWGHVRPLTMDKDSFESEMRSCKQSLEDILGKPVLGYRAPCFSLDRERLDILRDIGFKLDSSRIKFGDHPLYGDLNLDGFHENSQAIYSSKDFFEFEVSTLPIFGKQIPVSGGGYLRIFPWVIMGRLIEKYLKNNSFFTLYIHPFELSSRANPGFPQETDPKNKFRFSLGRSTVVKKLHALIELLRKNDYQFTTFSALRNKLIHDA
ncbi:MAG: polysaccharide deacetylase family protein [Nitrospinota bacterium]